MIGSKILIGLCLISQFVIGNKNSFAKEIDNYTTAGFQPVEMIGAWNEYYQSALEKVVREWKGKPNRYKLVMKFYREVEGTPIHNDFMSWYRKNNFPIYYPEHDIYENTYQFGKAPLIQLKVNFITYMNGVPIGMDKIGHFLEVGINMFKIVYGMKRPESAGINFADWTERSITGKPLSGVYSNGDLVADYEGYRFYRNLAWQDPDTGEGPNVEFVDGKPVIRRAIDMGVHVNSYWNEAMNPSDYVPHLHRIVKSRLPSRCDQFRANPEWYLPVNEDQLKEKYKRLPIRAHPELRMDRICN